MNKEENIQKIQDQIDKVKEYLEYGMPYSEYLDLQLAFDDIVNLIQKQEAIIDKMAEQLAGLTIWNDNIQEPLILGDKEEVKEYYKKEVEKE